MSVALWIALGAAIGAPARYLSDRAIQSWRSTAFPLGTFTVNLVASLALGALTGLAGHISTGLQAGAATGLCGALSTYSSFGFETMRLAQTARPRLAAGYLAASIVAGAAAAALGWWATSTAG